MKKQYKNYGIILVIVLIITGYFIYKNTSYPDIDSPRPILGNPDADVKIVEFSDFQCPACGSAHPMVKSLLEKFGDNVSYEMKHFPLTSIHPFAKGAAEAAECANDQGKYWEYADVLYLNQKHLEKKNLKKYAADIGLDTKKFNNCLWSGKKRRIITVHINEGAAKGLRGTPSFFINGRYLEKWSYDSFKEKILESAG